MKELLYVQALCEAIDEEMARDENVLVLGEDVGKGHGCFKVTNGLYEKYGADRVVDTPISEAGFVGMGVGMAICGLRPVVEIMFADFIYCAADQVVNQAAKICYMTGGQVKVPMVIRCPIGAGGSYAAQHSQSIQAVMAQFPGLKIALPSTAQEAKGLLKTAIRDNNPVIFLEHKREYFKKYQIDDAVDPIPFGKARIVREGNDITIVATSSQVMKAEAAASKLAEEGIECEIIDPRTIVPFDRDTIIASVKKTRKLVVVDETHETCGIASQIVADVLEDVFFDLDAPCGRVATPNVPFPLSPALEYPLLPSEEKIYNKVRSYF